MSGSQVKKFWVKGLEKDFPAGTQNTFYIYVLKKLRVEFPDQKITIVRDGAPYHRAELVKEA